jgi:eukaryotic-like serine/threonine-protein kinase
MSESPRMGSPERWGRYTLLRQLGAGGMAHVFLARQEGPAGFERYLIVKRILPGKLNDPEAVRSFLEEARLAAQLTHPNIAQVHDFGEVANSFFLAMELVRGPDLRRILATLQTKSERMQPELCAYIGSHVAAGLDYAHSLVDPQTKTPIKLVHRDISPDNVVISADGHIKIVDFGIAQAAAFADETHVEKLRGKVPYMSPEVLHGETIDRGLDLFALGLVIYEMAVGRRAVVGTKAEMLAAARAHDFPPPEALAPEIPDPLLRVIHKATAVNPKDRYRSAREMQIDLDSLIRSTPVTSHDLARLVRRLYPDGADPLATGPLSGQAEGPNENPTVPAPSTVLVGATLPSIPIRYQPWGLAILLALATAVGAVTVGAIYKRIADRRRAALAQQMIAPPPIPAPQPQPTPVVRTDPPPVERPAAPAVRRPPAVGSFTIEATPGGDVFIDHIRVGTAPLHKPVPVGTHEISVRYLGAEKRQTLPVADGEERRVSFSFGLGELRVYSIPWAIVTVDGKEYGATPLKPIHLPAGKHTVVLESQSPKKRKTRIVEVKEEGMVDLRVDLRQ